MNEVCISLDKNSKIKLYRQLYDKIVEFINTGIYKPDQKLPSIRLLSAQLDISKNTITKTYDELEKDNYIYSLVKKGYFVQNRNLLKDNVVPSSEEQDNESESSVPTVDSIIKQHKEPIFSTTALDESQKETDTITPQTVTVKQEAKPSITQSLLSYLKSISTSNPNTLEQEYQPFGQLEFRTAIAELMTKIFDINCTPEQIIISSGIQHLMLTTLRLPSISSPSFKSDGMGLLKLGDQINQGSIPRSKPLFAIPETINSLAEKIIMESNIPTIFIQNYSSLLKYNSTKTESPISLLLVDNSISFESNEEMNQILEWVQEIPGRYIIEYPSQISELSPFKANKANDRIIYVNSFKNIISNSCTASFAIMPQDLLNEYQQRFNHFSCSVSLLEQSILTEFINKEYLN